MSRLKSVIHTARQAWSSMKDKTAGASYTIMIAPDDTSRMVRHCVPKKWVRWSVYGAGALFALSLGMTADYVSVRARASEVERLRRETRQQKQELTALAKSMSEVQAQMDKLREFDTKLRVMTDVGGVKYQGDSPTSSLPASGSATGLAGQSVSLGGENPELVNPLREELSSTDEALLKNLSSSLSRIKNETSAQEQSFAELVESLEDQKSLLASTPSVWPVKGWLTSTFGARVSPFTGAREFHKGLDIATRSGMPVIAPADGTVVYIAREGGWGLTMIVDHGYGVKTQYGHLSETLVRVGKRVKRGEAIARVGNSGRSTGPHLHYEVSANGAAVNPQRYILN